MNDPTIPPPLPPSVVAPPTTIAAAPLIARRLTMRHWLILLCILTTAGAMRVWRLQGPAGYYFDEVYYGFTARQGLAGDRGIYDPFAKPPPDVAYEWTAPPVSKLIIQGTMLVAGPGDFGMRLSSAVMGTIAVLLVFLLGRAMFDSPRAGLLASFLLATDGLMLTHSRAALADMHFAVFVLASLVMYVQWRRDRGRSLAWLLGAGLSCGLAIATKWTGIYLLGVLGMDFLIAWAMSFARQRDGLRRPLGINTILTAFIALVILPCGVYAASYAQMFAMGYDWQAFKDLQWQMWHYHTGLVATHEYTSKPWQWMLDLRPVWLYVRYDGDRIANIYDLGNPVLLWGGLAAMAAIAYVLPLKAASDYGAAWLRLADAPAPLARWAGRPIWPAAFGLAVYLMLWLPWAMSPRIMFFYHYLPAVPLLCVGLAAVLDDLLASRWLWVKIAVWAVPILALVWLAVFFPHLTGISVPKWWADHAYYWFQSWR